MKQMKSRSILIEKHIEPSETHNKNGCYVVKLWFNEDGDLHSSLGHPAEVWIENKVIVIQYWYKKGVIHRDRDLPAYIEYKNEKITWRSWYKNGEFTNAQR
jgi:hypothetical protein